MNNKLIIKGARENNLKNINLTLPKNKLIVVTGVSGSGKSSLAFDTIYAEGERRYIESLSSYARQFLGNSKKPDVDSIEGLSPAISIDQKTTSNNPRSTVATATEIYDYLRLLFARCGDVYCPHHHIKIKGQTIEEMTSKILNYEEGSRIIIYAPLVRQEKGTHQKLIESLIKDGFVRAKIDGVDYDLNMDIKLDKNLKHDIYLVIDRIKLRDVIKSRLNEAIEMAALKAKGLVLFEINGEEILISENYACPYCNFSIENLEPRLFSFNAPFGACEVCNGLGFTSQISEDLVVPDKDKSINEGAILTQPKDPENISNMTLKIACEHFHIDMDKPLKKLSKKELDILFYGSSEEVQFNYETRSGNTYQKKEPFEGIINNLNRRYMTTESRWIRDWLSKYVIDSKCPKCSGKRLNEKALSVKINKMSIADMTEYSIEDLLDIMKDLKLSPERMEISKLIRSEIINRLTFLKDVGLSYLNLSRVAGTLSGGEAQRIRLATQIGSKLSGVLYVLDEPSIGLHQRDNQKLINALKEMRDLGNTLIVVEHDEETMKEADFLVDIGPGAGKNGGYLVAAGTPLEVEKNKDSLTGKYLSGELEIAVPSKRRKLGKKMITIKGAKNNNLKNIDVSFPLGVFTAVTGVSGSGKSTLVMDILSNLAKEAVYKTKITRPNITKVTGLNHIDKIVEITQDPIGRTPRSNPATYTGVFDDIRELFTSTKEARLRGFGKDRFSFNVKGGRCETCRGDGIKKIEMYFLPDVSVPCEACGGKRYNAETLKCKYKDKNIADVLDMTVDEALDFFENQTRIYKKLMVLKDVGLGYIKLGQSATTLSGGEASRVKLAKELQKIPTGKTLYIMDEPTTGLHIHDVKSLLEIIKKIVDNKDTVIIIEHNLDMIKCADYIIDLGPEGGDNGGTIIGTGTPEELAKNPKSYTGIYLKEKL